VSIVARGARACVRSGRVSSSSDLTFELDLVRVRLDMLVARRLVGLSPEEESEYARLSLRERALLRQLADELSTA
jgi:hypothetical protein